jgi:hypothetical protein
MCQVERQDLTLEHSHPSLHWLSVCTSALPLIEHLTLRLNCSTGFSTSASVACAATRHCLLALCWKDPLHGSFFCCCSRLSYITLSNHWNITNLTPSSGRTLRTLMHQKNHHMKPYWNDRTCGVIKGFFFLLFDFAFVDIEI